MKGTDLYWRVIYNGSRVSFNYSVEWSCDCSVWHSYQTFISTFIGARFVIWRAKQKCITVQGGELIVHQSHPVNNPQQKQK